jgi:hypothetical protein
LAVSTVACVRVLVEKKGTKSRKFMTERSSEKRSSKVGTRREQKANDLIAFASIEPLENVFGCWRNPRTKKLNRLGGPDVLIIDDVQREVFKNALLSASQRRERLEYFEQVGDKKYKRIKRAR